MSIINIIKKVFPKTPPNIIDQYRSSITHMDLYLINTPLRQAGFLSQLGHESGGFMYVEENLNYSADRLVEVFPKYFTKNESGKYHRNPEKIANRVYANRMGNGDEASGDGWKYRGRGLIQLTGKANYQKFSDFIGIDAVNNPDYIKTPDGSFISAIWFWDVNACNKFCDNKDVVGLTKRINGGINGLSHRIELFNTFLPLLEEHDKTVVKPEPYAPAELLEETLPPIVIDVSNGGSG